jgi:hypothetical protein
MNLSHYLNAFKSSNVVDIAVPLVTAVIGINDEYFFR